MLLNEFFNHAIDIGKNQKQKDRDNPKLGDDLFWYILDHDKLHKDYFFEIADKIKNLKECPVSMVEELFMPMVVKGCREFYSKNKLEGKLGKVFSKELREEMCQKLYDHYKDDVKQDKYRLG